jgi:ribosomal protein S13
MGRFNAAASVPVPMPVNPAATSPPLTVLPSPSTAQPAGSGRAKLNFAGLKTSKPSTKASEYPVLPDPEGKMAGYAADFLEAQEREEAAKGAKETARLELVHAAKPFYFATNAGRAEVPSSVAIESPKGEVRVTFKDKYKNLDESQFERVRQVVGDQIADSYLEQTFVFKIDSDAIPPSKMQAVIDEVQAMTARLGIGEAVSVTTCYKPTSEWHAARFRQLSAEQNIELEEVIDREKGFCQVSVGAARGRK